MTALDLVGLTPLIRRTRGRPDVVVGLIDGPVAVDHPGLAGNRVHELSPDGVSGCARAGSAACRHGTFVAGILGAGLGAEVPGVCPKCTLLVRPVFAEADAGSGPSPGATAEALAAAVVACVRAGARCINLSLALAGPSSRAEPELEEALDLAARRGVLVVAAAGNQGTLGGTAILRHPWVIPVAACDLRGRPTGGSNLGRSIGTRGLRAPGEGVVSLDPAGNSAPLEGTSIAAPFVTGAVALLLSAFPGATAAQVRVAITQAYAPRRTSVTPPLLDAWGAYQYLAGSLTASA